MAEIRFTMVDPSGLHARPAARFVQTASRFKCRVAVLHDGRQADAKSLLSLLGLGLRPGTVITLRAEGPDSTAAVAALTEELAPYVSAARNQ
jgi:phosphotransferase system HPr (HPr) family protein